MDEITLITDYVKELVGRDVDVIWGAGKDESLNEELHVAVIATGFNNSPVDTKRKAPTFKVERVDDLEMKLESAKEVEEEQRRRKQLAEENRRLRREQEDQQRRVARVREERVRKPWNDDEEMREFEDSEDEPLFKRKRNIREHNEEYDRDFEREKGRKRGLNEVPDVDSWFKRKLGNMFNEDMGRDSEM